VFNYLAGSLARIFTTIQEVDDKLILWGFIAAFALNAVLAAQMVYYWNSTKSKQTTQTKVEPKGKQAITQMTGVQTRSKNSPSTRRRG
jgi:mannose-P-dolichol utilization defect protein 1